MPPLSEQELHTHLTHNPLYHTLSTSTLVSVTEINGLEKEYTLTRHRHSTNYFDPKKPTGSRNTKGDNTLFRYIDPSKLLALYPGYDVIYGPYVDSCATIVQHMLVLYIRAESTYKLKTIYLTRALEEIAICYLLPNNYSPASLHETELDLSSYSVVNPGCCRVNYKAYVFNADEISKIKKLYPNISASIRINFMVNKNRATVSLKGEGGDKLLSLARLLVEIHLLDRVIRSDETVVHINGKSWDVSLDNLKVVDNNEDYEALKIEIFNRYKLDVNKLIEIYRPTGYDYVKNVYLDKPNTTSSNSGRRVVVLGKRGKDEQHTLLLSRALMTVETGRLLDPFMETVDHVDRDKTNDIVSNFRLVSRPEHVKEDLVNVEVDALPCPNCGKLFTPKPEQRVNVNKNLAGIFCSQSCGTVGSRLFRKGKLKPIKHSDIKYRYWVIDKVGTTENGRIYLDTLDYNFARKLASDINAQPL